MGKISEKTAEHEKERYSKVASCGKHSFALIKEMMVKDYKCEYAAQRLQGEYHVRFSCGLLCFV